MIGRRKSRQRKIEEQLQQIHSCIDRRLDELNGKIEQVAENSKACDRELRSELRRNSEQVRKGFSVLMAGIAASFVISVGGNIVATQEQRQDLRESAAEVVFGNDGLMKLLLSGLASYVAYTTRKGSKNNGPD